MEVYLFLGLHNSYFPPDIDFQVLVQVVSSKLLSDKSHSKAQIANTRKARPTRSSFEF